MGLSKLEIRVLKHINKSGYKGKSSIINFLKKNLALSHEKAMDFYTLWFLNYREDGNYEEITDPNKELRPLINILKKIKSGEVEPEDIPDKFFGDKLSECRTSGFGYGRYKTNTPCVELSEDTVYLSLDRDTWESQNFSGLYEEDLWKYYESQPSNYSDYSEEFDKEEFDYFNYNDETIDLIKQVAVSAKRKDVVDYIDENISRLETEKLAEYLEEMLPEDRFNNMRDEYIWEIDNITYNMRRESTRNYYDEEIKYNVSRDGNDFEMEIPLDEFIEIIEEHNPLSFSDVIEDEIPINPQLDLEGSWYDVGYWDSNETSHIEELNRHLQRIVDDLGEGGLDEYYSNLRYFEDILKNTGLEYKTTNWQGKIYSTPDGRLNLNSKDIDLYTKKITFTYDGEKHTVPLDNFMNWAQGSVLDLKYESVRYGKIPLREGKKTITKISIFDFDGTLADTPSKEDGIPIWEAKTGEEYPHKGWYSKRESLDENVFNIKLIQSTIKDYMVESVLSKNGVVFEEYHYKERGDTFTSKINTIKKLLSQNPNVSEIEMWEDRENHAEGFEQWGQQNGVNIRVNRVSI
jgi:hypothetical protein